MLNKKQYYDSLHAFVFVRSGWCEDTSQSNQSYIAISLPLQHLGSCCCNFSRLVWVKILISRINRMFYASCRFRYCGAHFLENRYGPPLEDKILIGVSEIVESFRFLVIGATHRVVADFQRELLYFLNT